MFLVIPNVSLNAVLDFDQIKNSLSAEERKYFFSALLDCVVIDTEDNYKPIRFIEIIDPINTPNIPISKGVSNKTDRYPPTIKLIIKVSTSVPKNLFIIPFLLPI